jgi:hypothetical protein
LCHQSEQILWILRQGAARVVDGKFMAFHVHMLLRHYFPVVRILAYTLMNASV